MSVPRFFALTAALAVLAAMGVAVMLARMDRPFMDVSPRKAVQLMRTAPGLVILDVRAPGEQSRGMIPDAIPTTLEQVASGSMHPPLGRPILVYCRTGSRSSKAARDLAARGHMEIYNLTGGLRAWVGEGLPMDEPREAADMSRSAP